MVTGKLALRNTDFYLQVANREHGGEEVELTPDDLRTLERRFGEAPRKATRLDEHPLALNLDVDLAGNDWVRRRSGPTVAVEVEGKLQVRKRTRAPLLVYGTIRPLAGRSFVELLGRRFEVTEGEVVLDGPPKQARLQVLAEYRADSGSTAAGGSPSGVIITTQVAVDSGQLSVDLGSRPRMSDEDIRSYLATGRPAGTDPTGTTEDNSVLASTTSLAVGAALGTVAGGAGQRLGFDVVQILQDRQGSQTLVAGKYVSPPLYLGFRQPIVARGGAGPDPGRAHDDGVGGGIRRPPPSAPQRARLGRRVPDLPPAPAVKSGGGCLAALGLLLAAAQGAAAQDSLIPVRRDAQVTSVAFRFAGTSTFSDGELGAHWRSRDAARYTRCAAGSGSCP